MEPQKGLSSAEKWRLILGSRAENEEPDSDEEEKEEGLAGDWADMDVILDLLYDDRKSAGLSKSAPRVNRWLGDIRRYFPVSVVQVMQKDALDRLDLTRMLVEPELLQALEKNVELLATLLTLSKVMPAETLRVARDVVREMVDEMLKRLQQPLERALRELKTKGSRSNKPRLREIDWGLTIRKNLQHFQRDRQLLIPQKFIGFRPKRVGVDHDIILLVDQSGSMASSVVYAGIYGSILASLPSYTTTVIAFDTEVVDLTEKLDDPVDLLFSFQLGGGTDISSAMRYARTQVGNPGETTLILISDLFEGGNQAFLLQEIKELQAEGVYFIVLLALSDEGIPAFDRETAAHLTALDIPVFACTPDYFPDMMATALMREDLSAWLNKNDIRSS